ncbi:MAG TPA: hypothetical protein DCQ51_11550 [Planktothrix sp. UBA8407]|jgi:Uncharacterized protein conserved in cyanobacteria|nr:hypothetical protein [Planktothrix sp. UBA8402]HAO11776.1 hypothetical protein [Planktothrix sp. UBA8407]HBK23274.1 hypothetical protein [Planktothrix sp. UBA10369]
MLQTTTKTYSFEDYLNYRDPTDLKYELFNGELIAMPPASGLHDDYRYKCDRFPNFPRIKVNCCTNF